MPDLAPQTIALAIVVANGEERRLLIHKDGALSNLTTVTLVAPPSDPWRLDALSINRAMREQIGLSATLLRCLDVGMGQDSSADHRTGTLLVESHDPDWTPGDHLTLKALAATTTSLNISRRVLLNSTPAPWTHTGWFEEASDWMRAQLEALGVEVTGAVEQVRAWFLSCILRVATPTGVYYLKAVPSLFRHEPLLALDLSERHPGFVPDVVAVDAARHWTLMRNVPGVKLVQHPDKSQYLLRWEGILLRYAEVQLDYASRVDDLLAMGCFDFRLDRLYSDAEALFAELPRLLDEANGLASDQIALLTGYLPQLRAMCDTLIDSGLPPTLHHGDFHSGNILCDQACVLLDWSGFVGVSHPFLFLSVVSEEHTDEAALARLVEVYLFAWSAYGPMRVLKELARSGIVLGWLAGAVGHSRQIAIGDGPWDIQQEQGNLQYCLKMLLRLLSA